MQQCAYDTDIVTSLSCEPALYYLCTTQAIAHVSEQGCSHTRARALVITVKALIILNLNVLLAQVLAAKSSGSPGNQERLLHS